MNKDNICSYLFAVNVIFLAMLVGFIVGQFVKLNLGG